MSSVGVSRARRTASSKASPLAIRVVAVRMPLAMRLHDALVDVRSETEIVGVDDELFARGQNSMQPDREELLGIGPHVLGQRLEFARRAGERVVQLRVHHQLPQRALSGVDLVDGAVELGHQFVQPLVQHVVLEQLARRALAGIEIAPAAPRISASDALASSYSAGSLSSLPALPFPACRSASSASTRLIGERSSW